MTIWMGGIFLKDEGGYEIVLKALEHYKKRLQTIHQSPELQEAAAMFAPITANSLEEDLEILEKALECRKSDIEKAQDTGKEYFVKLLGDLQEAVKDLESLKTALVKIKEYSD